MDHVSLRGVARCFGVVAFALFASATNAQNLEYIKANYTKYEHRVPMRDGKRLFTAIYVPKDRSRSYPILLSRTPYSCSPYGVDNYRASLGPSQAMCESGYIFVHQDVRGRWMSEGEFVDMRPHQAANGASEAIDESDDTFDTIEWLIKHVEGHNGRVGQWGVSYPGFYTAAGMIDAHPALVAASPQAPIMDWFVGDDWHHHGAVMLPHAFNFIAVQGKKRPEPTKKFVGSFDHGTNDGYQFFLEMGPLAEANAKYLKDEVPFWNEVMRHGVYDDFWEARNLRPHLRNIAPAVLTVGGWFDAENLFGALECYQSVERQSPGTENMLVMGPWVHGGWRSGDADHLRTVPFNSKTGEFFRDKIETPFFEFHLKDKGERPSVEAWMFETGTNQWRSFREWPPAESKNTSFYLSAGGTLADRPAEDESANAGYDEYTSDPARPVPFVEETTIRMPSDYMIADQRFASRRPDVLVYQTAELENDLTVAGPIDVELFVSTSGTDSDFIVKLIDVYPNDFTDPDPNPTQVRMGGYQQLVRGEVFRGKFREGYEKPVPFTPNRPARVAYAMPDVCHTFRSGHRVMVQVQSSWFPLIDRNPQTFVDIYTAKASDFVKAMQRVYHEPDRASRVMVRTLE